MKVRTLIRLFYKDRKLNRILQIFFTGSGLSVVWLCFLRIGQQRKPRSPSSPPPALQQRGKEPHERLAQSLRKRSPQPFRRNKPPARAQVFVENTTHCRIEILSVNERVDFEVVLETAEIHVRRTHNRQTIPLNIYSIFILFHDYFSLQRYCISLKQPNYLSSFDKIIEIYLLNCHIFYIFAHYNMCT